MSAVDNFVCQSCGECCGIIPVTKREWRNIKKEVRQMPKEEQTRLSNQERQPGTCYKARPTICSMQGEYEGLECPRQPECAVGTKEEGYKHLRQMGATSKIAGILGIDLGWDEANPGREGEKNGTCTLPEMQRSLEMQNKVGNEV